MLTGMKWQLRICLSDDVALLASVHAETVGFAYAGFFPPNAPPPTASELQGTWAERVADPTSTAFVAFEDRRPIGFGDGPSRSPLY